jgi:transcriptional regulator with XRE-family HTH domain
MSNRYEEVLAEEMRKVRERKKLTQQTLAKMTGLSQGLISHVENANDSKLSTLDKLCQAMGISLSTIIARTEKQLRQL